MYKKILIPIDIANLEHSDESLKIAHKLLSDGGQITLIYVIENLPENVIAELPGRFMDDTRNDARSKLQKIITSENVKADIAVHSGNPAGSIVQVAKEQNFDLIILSSHKPNMMNYILGSTADRVVRKAQCPIFITR